MLRRIDVTLEKDIRAPREIGRIEGASDHEPLIWQAFRGLEKKPAQLRLPIFGIGPEIGQRRPRPFRLRRRAIAVRIDRAIKRRHPRRAEALAQGRQRHAPGIAQNQIEPGKAVAADIADLFAGAEPRQSDRAVEIIKDAHGPAIKTRSVAASASGQ